MEVPFTKKFEEQKKQFSFCFTCETCAHYDAKNDECLHEYPNQMHKMEHYQSNPRPVSILFCKDYDLK